MARSTSKEAENLLKRVEERALAKKVKEQEILVPYLPKECISAILLRLPLQSLSTMRFVCKQWYNIITSLNFINAHLRQAESVLIYEEGTGSSSVRPFQEQSNCFSVEARLLQSKPSGIFKHQRLNGLSKFYVRYMEIKEGNIAISDYNLISSGNIRATCNGLILIDNTLKKGGLVVMNPVTKKFLPLPVGTLCPPHNESYGFAFNEVTSEYKVVHLFRDELGYIGCETLCIGGSRWREVNGPSFGLFGWLGYNPVSAIGAFHWVPHISGSNYLVSMEFENNKFHTTALPKESGINDRIIKKDDCLCFVRHEELSIEVWMLKCLSGERWNLHHRITKAVLVDMVAVSSMRISGDMIFMVHEHEAGNSGSFFVYDERLQRMVMVGREKLSFGVFSSCLTHVNSLVSWERTSLDV